MAQTNNPAGRLYAILREAKRQVDQQSVRAAWANVFGFRENEIARIYSHLAELNDVLDQVESEILLLALRHEVYLKHFPTLKQAILASNLDEPWSRKKAQLTEQALDTLEICSERLEALRPEKVVDAEKLEELRAEIASLFTAIEASDIPSDLKSVLLGILNSMQEALAQYRMRGVEGLRQEWYQIYARLERHTSEIMSQKSNPVVVRFMLALGTWDTISSVYINSKQLFGEVIKMIGSSN